jgi:hypothetical protein
VGDVDDDRVEVGVGMAKFVEEIAGVTMFV